MPSKRRSRRRAVNAAGGVFTDIRDLLAYARFQLGDGTAANGTRLLAQTTLARMHAAVAPKLGSQDDMAITWHLSTESGVAVHAHGGGTNGQISYLALVPSKRLAVAVLTNAGTGSQLNPEVLKATLREYAGVTMREPVARAGTDSELQAFVGTWRRQFQDVVISRTDTGLRMQVVPKLTGLDGHMPPAPAPVAISLAGGGGLMFTEGPRARTRIDAVPGDDGAVTWPRIGSRIHRRVVTAATSASGQQ